MPSKLTDEKIQKQKDLMYEKGVQLICKKGLTNIILEDITEACEMAKGSFYRYYNTKEIYLYEVIKRNEAFYFGQLMNSKDMRKTFEDVFLSDEFLFCSLLPEDLDYLLKRLPPEYLVKEQQKSHNNFEITAKALGITANEVNYGTLSYLLDGLQSILRSPGQYGEKGRKNAATMMIHLITDFITEEMK